MMSTPAISTSSRWTLDSFQKKTLWLFALALFGVGVYWCQEMLFLLFFAFILSSALWPWVERLDRKLPRWLAVLFPYLIFILLLFLVVLPLLSSAFGQLEKLIMNLPMYLTQVRKWLEYVEGEGRRYRFITTLKLDDLINQLLTYISVQSGTLFNSLTGITILLSKGLLNILTVLIISFFMLLDKEKIEHYLLRFIPDKEHVHTKHLITELTHRTGAFVSGQLIFMATFTAMITAGLYLLNVPFALLFGILAGLLTIIPIIGPNIALIPTLLVSLVSSGDPAQLAWILFLFIVVQMLENNILGPLIMGKAVGLHPLGIIIAILAGGMLFGLVGIILAIPLAACVHIILEEWLIKQNTTAIKP